uniref:ABC transporter permease n=1 Tax=Acidobacterium capsulatum TaxID=33075 RepID=A0A7V5CSZ0_9BACT
MRTWMADISFALRQLRKAPGFALLAVLTLAFGIGANTAMFTVLENVLLRPLPYAGASRLVAIQPGPGTDSPRATSWLDYRDIRHGLKNVAEVAGYSDDLAVVQGKDTSTAVAAPHVTPSLLRMLGTKPLLGRTFTPQEGLAGGPQVVLLSEGIWRKVFHSDPDIVGKVIHISSVPHTVVGVMPASFGFPEEEGSSTKTAIWLPLQPTHAMLTKRGYSFFLILGKLHPGVSMVQARAQLHLVSKQLADVNHDPARDGNFTMLSYAKTVVGSTRPVLMGLFAALLLVLLIACANVANLLLARAIGRQQEFAVRVALGAGRARLLRQVMTEGAVLSGLGCVAGFALATAAIESVHKLPPDTIPRMSAIHLRWTVVLVMAAIATFTTVLSSLLPAVMVSGVDPQATLQSASRGVGTRSVRGKLTAWLVMAEIALSTLLLVSTGLLARTMWNLEHAWLGFQTTRLTTFQVTPPNAAGFSGMSVSSNLGAPPTSVAVLSYDPVLARLREAPGIENAAYTTMLPLTNSLIQSSFSVVEHPAKKHHEPQALMTAVGGDYAKLMGTPMLRGRMIDADDKASAPPVAVINEEMAKKYFAGRNPIGEHLDLGGKDTGIVVPPVIVGVIANERTTSMEQPAQPMILLPGDQIPTTSLFYQALVDSFQNFIVKTRGNIPVAREVRDVFDQQAPGFALDNFQTMQTVVNQTTFNQRLGLDLTASFAGMAILMVIAGLYGVLSQFVGFRRREIGIRLALGASRQQILRMIFRQSLMLAGYGLGCGLVISMVAGRLLRSFLYGVQPFDLPTYAGVLGLLLLVSVAAAVWPAKQAASVDPMATLRMD